MKRLVFVSLLLLPVAASAVDWRALSSPPQYQSMLDFDSVSGVADNLRFILRREFSEAQNLPTGRTYHSTRLHVVADCTDKKMAPETTAYYGQDRRLLHTEMRINIRKTTYQAPDSGSDIADALNAACQRAAEGPLPASPPPQITMKPAPKPVARGSSGSGIIVGEGQVLTNNHVVLECDAHEVIDGNNVVHKAALQVSDPQRDLALLSVDTRFANVARVRSDAAPKLGESITVVGYPLVNVLGSNPTVGFGHVSSTTGIRNNPTQMQISVPIQRGNSGGPVFDQAGNVIGVVVSKLDALKMAASLGDLPQNVNFAIRGEVMRLFLENNRVNFTASRSSSKLENTDIASQGAAVTVRVRCMRNAVPVIPTSAPSP